MAIVTARRPCAQRCDRVARSRVANCRVVASASAQGAGSSTRSSSTALSITATAAASALLAKVSALTAVGMAPGALLSLLHGSAAAALKPAEKVAPLTTSDQALAAKVAVAIARAPAPAADADASALPRGWDVASSAAHWFELNRQATAAGALLATVFVSDKAARAHGPLLERLRVAYGTGAGAPVRFVFVHVGDAFQQRSRVAAAAAAARGSRALTLGRVSHTAAHHGLDVALASFLPDGVHAFPSVLLTAGSAAADRPPHVASATRVGELTQLVSDWAFLINRRRAAAAAATVTAPAAIAAVPEAGAKEVPQPAGMSKPPTVVQRSAAKVLVGV